MNVIRVLFFPKIRIFFFNFEKRAGKVSPLRIHVTLCRAPAKIKISLLLFVLLILGMLESSHTKYIHLRRRINFFSSHTVPTKKKKKKKDFGELQNIRM